MSSEESPMIRTVVCCIALCTYLLSAPGIARSQTGEGTAKRAKPLKERWLPAISTGLFLFDYEAPGAIIDSIDSTAGFSDSASNAVRTPIFQIGLELMTPSLQRLPAGPRVVGFAGVQVGPNQELDLAGVNEYLDGDATAAAVADASYTDPIFVGIEPQQGYWPAADSFSGQGSELVSTYLNGGWYLGLGMVFEMPNREERDPIFRLRPFVTYVGERVRLTGDLARVTGERVPVDPWEDDSSSPNYGGNPTGYNGDYTLYRTPVRSWETFHYLGPGIDAEVVLASDKTTTLSLFGQISFLWNMGTSSVTLSDPAGNVTFRYTADDFSIRPGGGLRLSWRGGL